MGKSTHPDVIDAALNYIKSNVTKMIACSAQPTTYNEAVTTYALADVTVASGDFTLANGDTSGRKVTRAAKTGVTVDANGTVTHIAEVDVSNTKLVNVTTTSSQGVSTGGTVDIGSFKNEIANPS
jgi:hypothetical protein